MQIEKNKQAILEKEKLLQRIKRRLGKPARMGYKAKDDLLFELNHKIAATVVHHGGKTFRKGVTYNAVKEGIIKPRFDHMMKLKMNGMSFFLPAADDSSGYGQKEITGVDLGSASGGVPAGGKE